MGVKLTFRKDFIEDSVHAMAKILPYTVDGEPIDCVISCCVESSVDMHVTRMTMVVAVTEDLGKNTATRVLTGKKEKK